MLIPPKPVDAAVIYDPLLAQLLSVTILGSHDKLNGLSQWSIDSADQMSAAEQAVQGIVRWLNLDGFVNIIPAGHHPQSIPEYVQLIDSIPAEELRNQLLLNNVNAVHFAVGSDYWQIPASDPLSLLNNYEQFKNFYQELTKTKYDIYDVVDVRYVFDTLNDPQALKNELVSHLNMVWHRFLEREWRTAGPAIQHCVEAFQSIRLLDVTMLEAIEAVTGRDIRAAFRLDKLLEFEKVRFIPDVHSGPYVIWFGQADTLIIAFPVRDLKTSAPVFDKSTMVNRFKALSDENRVSILLALAEAGTLTTAEIIERFDFDKSAASRHLRQLVATSLIDELRIEKAKKGYQLNRSTIAELDEALKQLL
ncbi:MAG: winged helix-turn-helix domain-containing protein [Chloroflexota bacterium]